MSSSKIFQNEEKEIELIVTYKCNWDCPFCAVDTHNRKPLSFDKIKEKLNIIKEKYLNYNITISGGEPGLLKESEIEYILDFLKPISKSISLNTNGLFLEKYLKYSDYFDYILYHCSEDLLRKPNISVVKEWQNKNVKVDYLIVIDDKNFKNFDDFMISNKDIPVNVVCATKADGGLDSILSNRNRWKLLSKTRNYKNITKDSIKRLLKEKNYNDIIYI